MLLQQSIKHVSIEYTCKTHFVMHWSTRYNSFCSLGQYSYTIVNCNCFLGQEEVLLHNYNRPILVLVQYTFLGLHRQLSQKCKPKTIQLKNLIHL